MSPQPLTLKTYTITASAGTGGSISPSGGVSVQSGANQTFTITPNTGYKIADCHCGRGISGGDYILYVLLRWVQPHYSGDLYLHLRFSDCFHWISYIINSKFRDLKRNDKSQRLVNHLCFSVGTVY